MTISKKDRHRRKEKSLRDIAFAKKKKHDSSMTGKKIILIPHPTVPHTMIEKIVSDDE